MQPPNSLGASRGNFGRILRGIGANFLGRFWILALQLASVPVLTMHWGASGYGQWLMLTAVSTYIALSDFGFGNAAAASMIKSISQGHFEKSNTTFTSVWATVSSIALAVCLFAGVTFLFLYNQGQVQPHSDKSDFYLAASALCVHAFFALQMNLLHVVYRSCGRYALGTLFQEIVYPIEGITVLILALLGFSIVPATISMLAIRVVFTALYYRKARTCAPWFTIDARKLDFKEIKELSAAAIATFNINLSSAVSLQGIILTLGTVAHSAIAGLFGASRTIARAPMQIANLLTRATLPELTAALARDDRSVAARIILGNLISTVSIFLPAVIVISIFGPFALSKLSHGNLSADHRIFMLLSLSVLVQSTWQAAGQYFVAINKPQAFAFQYTVIAFGVTLSPFLRLGNPAHAASTAALIGEILMVAVVYSAWRREGGMSRAEFGEAADWLLEQLRGLSRKMKARAK